MNDLEGTGSSLPDVKEAYRNLQVSLSDEDLQVYNSLLQKYFTRKLSFLKFDEEARKILFQEQLPAHDLFMISLSEKVDKTPLQHREVSLNDVKYSAQEFCLPNENLLRDRIDVNALQNGLDGVEDGVVDLLILSCQYFIKNVLTAVISRKSNYKLRENNFQYAVGQPAPNPWLRNFNYIVDPSQESNVTVSEDAASFEPILRNDLDSAQQQTAFNIACGVPKPAVCNKITLRSLYETLVDNPEIINNNTISSVLLERIVNRLTSE